MQGREYLLLCRCHPAQVQVVARLLTTSLLELSSTRDMVIGGKSGLC